MNELLDQIERACGRGDFYLALFSCLTLPDICGALSSSDGRASGSRFKSWFNQYVSFKYQGNFSGESCYAFRCAALHQGRTDHNALGYSRILFLAPSQSGAVMHNNVLNDALNLDISEFCADVIAGVRQWLIDDCANAFVQKNLESMLRRHAGGIPPYVTGADIYS